MQDALAQGPSPKPYPRRDGAAGVPALHHESGLDGHGETCRKA
ncbi:hypothetical protein [Ottowia oryzae]|nr:hypothetical protein [Ottowia oryzae]